MKPSCKILLSLLTLAAAHPASATDAPAADSSPLDLTAIDAGSGSRERLGEAQVQTRIEATLQADGSVLLHCQHEHSEAAHDPRRPEQEQ